MSLFVDIQKRLGSFTLRVTFQTDGALMALLGASGSGKSVTLKCIAGILTPDCGKIVLDGITLFDSEKKINLPPQKRQVGYLFQQYALFPNMTVAQNIACAVREKDRAKRRALLSQQLSRFRLSELSEKYPAQLSGGEQQRVALARILSSEPKAILLDEPFSALDSFLHWNLELEVRELLHDFKGELIWVSHDLGECCRNCENVCILENGCSAPVMKLQELLESPPDLSAARIVGCRSFLPASRCERGVKPDGWAFVLPISAQAEQLIAAIPPDAAVLTESGAHAVVSRVVRELRGSVAVLLPERDSDAAPIVARIPEGMRVEEGQEVCFAIDAERCFLYPNPEA